MTPSTPSRPVQDSLDSAISRSSITNSSLELFLNEFVAALLEQATENITVVEIPHQESDNLHSSGEDADESSLGSTVSDSTKESIVIPPDTAIRLPGTISPSKRTREMMKEDLCNTPSTDRLSSTIYGSSSENSSCSLTPLFQNLISHSPIQHQTPIGKIDFTNPDQRYLWDKENWDAQNKCFSNDRKKKRAKKTVDSKGKSDVARFPLQDITEKKILAKKNFGQERSVNVNGQNTLQSQSEPRPLFIRRATWSKKAMPTDDTDKPFKKSQNNGSSGASTGATRRIITMR